MERTESPPQLPLCFANPQADLLAKELTAFGNQSQHRIAYMGPRPPSNLHLFRTLAQALPDTAYPTSFPPFVPPAHTRRYKPLPPHSSEYRLFCGMNPTLACGLQFDSNFESGNLDLVITVGEAEYDLLLRVDSNTRGHCCWFNFRVRAVSAQRGLFHLVNLGRQDLLYSIGMRIYCSRGGREWAQSVEAEWTKRGLTFSYDFAANEEVTFAYSLPYSYSYLLHRLESLQQSETSLKVDFSHRTACGLPLPLLTLGVEQGKPVCLIAGRLHPGESQGSWVLDGFLRYLCSSRGQALRERLSFVIMPMVNVDGVVLGNFRTGVGGRDLNRTFDHPESYPEVSLIRAAALRYKPLIFLDFHGHSSKKNVFCYGPDYSLDHRHYLPCRLLPKLLSRNCPAFRYHSCNYRLQQDRDRTARAVMLREHNVPFSFTVETSVFGYGPRGKEVRFDREGLLGVGGELGAGLGQFIGMLRLIPRVQTAQVKRKDKQALTSRPHLNAEAKLMRMERWSEKRGDCGEEMTVEEERILQEVMGEARQPEEREREERVEAGRESDCEEEGQDYSQDELRRIMSGEPLPSPRSKRGRMTTQPAEVSRLFHYENITHTQSAPKKTASLSLHYPLRKNRPRVLKQLSSVSPQLPTSDSVVLCTDRYQEQSLAKLEAVSEVALEPRRKPRGEYQPLSESKRFVDKRGRESLFVRKREETTMRLKQSVLPLLGRSGNMTQQESSSLVSQLLEEHERNASYSHRRRTRLLPF